MKKLLLLMLAVNLVIGLTVTNSYADHFIVNNENEIVSKTRYVPDEADLESRHEIAIEDTEGIPFEEAEYRGNKIVRHVETQEEKDKKIKKEKKSSELQLINNKIHYDACIALEGAGTVFDEVKCTDFQ